MACRMLICTTSYSSIQLQPLQLNTDAVTLCNISFLTPLCAISSGARPFITAREFTISWRAAEAQPVVAALCITINSIFIVIVALNGLITSFCCFKSDGLIFCKFLFKLRPEVGNWFFIATCLAAVSHNKEYHL